MGPACDCYTDKSPCIKFGLECSGHVSIEHIYSISSKLLEMSWLNCFLKNLGNLRVRQMQMPRRGRNNLQRDALPNLHELSKSLRGIEALCFVYSLQGGQSHGSRVQQYVRRIWHTNRGDVGNQCRRRRNGLLGLRRAGLQILLWLSIQYDHPQIASKSTEGSRVSASSLCIRYSAWSDCGCRTCGIGVTACLEDSDVDSR